MKNLSTILFEKLKINKDSKSKSTYQFISFDDLIEKYKLKFYKTKHIKLYDLLCYNSIHDVFYKIFNHFNEDNEQYNKFKKDVKTFCKDILHFSDELDIDLCNTGMSSMIYITTNKNDFLAEIGIYYDNFRIEFGFANEQIKEYIIQIFNYIGQYEEDN